MLNLNETRLNKKNISELQKEKKLFENNFYLSSLYAVGILIIYIFTQNPKMMILYLILIIITSIYFKYYLEISNYIRIRRNKAGFF